jgi:hypothetical protein
MRQTRYDPIEPDADELDELDEPLPIPLGDGEQFDTQQFLDDVRQDVIRQIMRRQQR